MKYKNKVRRTLSVDGHCVEYLVWFTLHKAKFSFLNKLFLNPTTSSTFRNVVSLMQESIVHFEKRLCYVCLYCVYVQLVYLSFPYRSISPDCWDKVSCSPVSPCQSENVVDLHNISSPEKDYWFTAVLLWSIHLMTIYYYSIHQTGKSGHSQLLAVSRNLA